MYNEYIYIYIYYLYICNIYNIYIYIYILTNLCIMYICSCIYISYFIYRFAYPLYAYFQSQHVCYHDGPNGWLKWNRTSIGLPLSAPTGPYAPGNLERLFGPASWRVATQKKVLALMDQTGGILHWVPEFIGWFWTDWGFGAILDIPSVGMNSSLHRSTLNPFWNLALELIRVICSMVEPCVTQAACWHETANGIYLIITGSLVIYPNFLRNLKLPRLLERGWEKSGWRIKFWIAINTQSCGFKVTILTQVSIYFYF